MSLQDRVQLAISELPQDTPPDAKVQAIASMLNAPCPSCLSPRLKVIDLPKLQLEGLLTRADIEAMMIHPLTSEPFRQLVSNWSLGVTSMPAELPDFLTLLEVAGIFDRPKTEAILNRFNVDLVYSEDQNLPPEDQRFTMESSSWALTNLGRYVTGSDIKTIIEEINGNP